MRSRGHEASEPAPAPPLVVRYLGGTAAPGALVERTFRAGFRVGRDEGCDLVVAGASISREHAEIAPVEGLWILTDRRSANGTWIDGAEVSEVVIDRPLRVVLGREGATLELSPGQGPTAVGAAAEEAGSSAMPRALARALRRADGALPPEVAVAVAARARRLHRRYLAALLVMGALLVAVGAGAWGQRQRSRRLWDAVDGVFYAMKDAELALLAASGASERQALQTLRERGRRVYEMLIVEGGGARRYATAEEQIVLRVVRALGECDAEAPEGFVAEVLAHVEGWRTPRVAGDLSTTRFEGALRRAEREGHLPVIVEALAARGLPSRLLYLAMQESNFDVRQVGPPTAAGFAKGMWQFIPATGADMGLRIGPRVEEPVYDPLDERHDFAASTEAAADYLSILYRGSAQASGLLVMARYNWGEYRVGALVDQLDANPRDRNFWQLVERFRDRLPDETYDYVLNIVAAAVIGEDPRLFGLRREPVLTGMERDLR